MRITAFFASILLGLGMAGCREQAVDRGCDELELDNLEATPAALASLQEEIQQLRAEAARCRQQVQAEQALLEETASRHQQLHAEIQAAQDQYDQLRSREQQLQSELEAWGQRRDRLVRQYRTGQRRVAELAAEHQQRSRALSELLQDRRGELQRLENRLDSLSATQRSVTVEIESLQRRRETLAAEVAVAERRLAESRQPQYSVAHPISAAGSDTRSHRPPAPPPTAAALPPPPPRYGQAAGAGQSRTGLEAGVRQQLAQRAVDMGYQLSRLGNGRGPAQAIRRAYAQQRYETFYYPSDPSGPRLHVRLWVDDTTRRLFYTTRFAGA